MKCATIKEFRPDGKPVFKRKKKFDSLEEAQTEVDKINGSDKIFIMRKAYKCPKCKKFHIGTTTKMLPDKPLPKQKWAGVRSMKIVGQIDLDSTNKYERRSVGVSSNNQRVFKGCIKETNHTTKKITLSVGKGSFKTKGGILWRYKQLPKTVKITTVSDKNKYIKSTKLFPNLYGYWTREKILIVLMDYVNKNIDKLLY